MRPGTLRRVLITLGLASIVFILLYLLRRFAGALLLIFASVLFGIFLRGLAVLFARWLRMSLGWALTLVVLLLFGIVGAFSWLAGPQVAWQV